MGNKITINPVTRLEGHGKIDIFLNDNGDDDHPVITRHQVEKSNAPHTGLNDFNVVKPAAPFPDLPCYVDPGTVIAQDGVPEANDKCLFLCHIFLCVSDLRR